MEIDTQDSMMNNKINMKEFIFNKRLNNLLTEMMKLDDKLKNDESSLKDDIGFKEFKYHFNPITIKGHFSLGMMGFGLLLSSSMLMAVFIHYFIQYGINKLIIVTGIFLTFFFLLSVFSGFLFLGRGDKKGIYINRTLYQIILVSGVISLIYNYSDGFLHVLYFSIVILLSLLTKLIMNSQRFFNMVIEIKCFKITHLLLRKDSDNIMKMSKKQYRIHLNEIEHSKRMDIRKRKKYQKENK
ncbi:hypothetical protein ABLA30_15225 [Xenorhabdus nematophila]|uniref:hypothetical protein n=1 Tax=Xenorhabdus nematophila TaxID=628 RepID=UPI001E5842A1|nr:hypothetical protein [Xenorhabdus nematophila]